MKLVQRHRDALVLTFPDARFVVLAPEVASFDAHRGADQDRPGLVLGEELGVEEPLFGAAVRTLSVRGSEGPRLFRTRATIQLLALPDDHFWRLPAILVGRCAPWIRGVVGGVGETGAMAARLAVWIDLRCVGTAVAGVVS